MRFIDLFAGLGGFHLALSDLGHQCVFASEINPDLQTLYTRNHGLRPAGDIRSVDVKSIPAHDILCAGFPCQPFSKAGEQQGFDCPRWGDLFEFVLEVLEHHRPTYFILENVPNIIKHDDGRTWREIVEKLRSPEWGYDVDPSGRLSPHQFGVPQVRDRIFIVGSRGGLDGFAWPKPTGKQPNLGRILNRKPGAPVKALPKQYVQAFDTWQKFLDLYPVDRKLPSFPIWSMEFGATYPYEETTPYALAQTQQGIQILQSTSGNHGQSLTGLTKDEIFDALPAYARSAEQKFPKWKIQFIKQNRALYEALRPAIDDWIPNVLHLAPSLQKFEWNYQAGERDIWRHLIQIRASGVRVKRSSTAPSLVAMTTTQIPIIGSSRETKRFLTPREAARLQSMHKLKHLPASEGLAWQALGNAVNTEVVVHVARALLTRSSGRGEAKPDESIKLEAPTQLLLQMSAA